MTREPAGPGVYARTPEGDTVRLHQYQDGDYLLTDVTEIFGLGRVEATEEGTPALILRDNEARQLKSLAYTHSFDCEEGFIALCLELHRFAAALGAPEVRFWSDL